MGHESLNIWVLGFRFFCSVSRGFFREKINPRGVLLNQKTWCSVTSSFYHYVWGRDGAVSLTGCSYEIKKSASLSDSTAKSRCVKRRRHSGRDSWVSSRSFSAASTCAKGMLGSITLELFHLPQLCCFPLTLLSSCLLLQDQMLGSKTASKSWKGDIVHWWMRSSEPVERVHEMTDDGRAGIQL